MKKFDKGSIVEKITLLEKVVTTLTEDNKRLINMNEELKMKSSKL